MRERSRFFCIIFLLLPGVAFASKSGVVKDYNTDETLIGVSIFLNQDNNTVSNGARGVGTTTDLDGRFEIAELPEDAKFIQFLYVGYETRVLPLKDGQVYDVKLVAKEEIKPSVSKILVKGEKYVHKIYGRKLPTQFGFCERQTVWNRCIYPAVGKDTCRIQIR